MHLPDSRQITYVVHVVPDDDGRDAESAVLHHLHHTPAAVNLLDLQVEMK
jgi:hypothetical protein